MMISSKIKPRQIWLTYLHYQDHPEIGKVRPILVLEVVDCIKEIIAAKITSKPPRNDTNDIEIEEWQQAGLRCLSTVRLDYLFKIPFDQLLREVPIGTVSKDLFIQILNNFTSYHRRV